MAITFGGGGLQSVAGTSLTGPGSSTYNRPSGGGSSSGGGGSSGGGSSGGGSRRNRNDTVAINGNVVTINGLSYTVTPGNMSSFLQSRGLSGGSYQEAIKIAKEWDSKQLSSSQGKQLLLSRLQQNNQFDKNLAGQNNVIRNLYAKVESKKKSIDLSLISPQSEFFNKAKENITARNTVNLLADETGTNVLGVKYRGKSYSKDDFENKFNLRILYDEKNKTFFFGTRGAQEKNISSRINAEFKPIKKEETAKVKRGLKEEKIINVLSGKITVTEAITNIPLSKWSNYAYEKVSGNLTRYLNKYSEIAKKQAVEVLNNSSLKSGSPITKFTSRTFGWAKYVKGSANAYALNMLSGLGNIALGMAFKPRQTSINLIKSSPAMIKSSVFEVGRTFTGRGTIEDFFGTALTTATLATSLASFSKLASKLKYYKATNKGLKSQLPEIRRAISQSQTLLKKQQIYTQRVFMQNSNKWNTFGKAYQAMKGMKAKHEWLSISKGKASLIIQKSVIQNSKVRMTNIMVAKTFSEKIFRYLGRWNNGQVRIVEKFVNSNKLASYLSKVRAARAYTFVEVRGSKFVTAIDGRGRVSLLRSAADVKNFVKNARFGKFSFTGKRLIGGNVETILKIGKKGFIGSEAFSTLGYKPTAGISVIAKEPIEKGGVKIFNYFRGKNGSKVFRTIKEQANSDYAWTKSVQNAIKNLENWGKTNPEQVRSLIKDLKRVYNPKEITYKQWRASTLRAGRKLDNFIRKNPNKFKSLVEDSRKIYGREQQLKQIVRTQAKTELPEGIGISKGISSSAVGSQLKGVSRAIYKAIKSNGISIKNGYKAVIGTNGIMFFTNSGKLVSPRVATGASNKDIDIVRDKIIDIVGSNLGDGQKSTQQQKPLYKSGQTSEQKQEQQMEVTYSRAGSSRSNLKFKPDLKLKEPILTIPNRRKSTQIVKSILGNKLAPSYNIFIGSGNKMKKLPGRYNPQDAISKGAYTIDRTKERTVRIVPTKQKPNSKFKLNYLVPAGKKFRNYRIKQGKRVKYSSTRLIEKRKYFNDLERLNRFKKKKRK